MNRSFINVSQIWHECQIKCNVYSLYFHLSASGYMIKSHVWHMISCSEFFVFVQQVPPATLSLASAESLSWRFVILTDNINVYIRRLVNYKQFISYTNESNSSVLSLNWNISPILHLDPQNSIWQWGINEIDAFYRLISHDM